MDDETLKTAIKLILNIVIFVAVLSVFVGFLMLFQDRNEQGTLESFRLLENAIDKSINADTQINALAVMHIQNGYKIIGYNEDENLIKQTCGISNPDQEKPKRCGANACIALCLEGKPCSEGLIELKVIQDVRNIIAKDLDKNHGKGHDPANSINIDGEYLSLFGGCGVNFFGVEEVYVSKEGTNLFISSDPLFQN